MDRSVTRTDAGYSLFFKRKRGVIIMRKSEIPSLAALQEFDVNRRGEYEGIRQTFYDSATYAAAGQTQLQFFQTPKGQGGKTVADTNMTVAGQLPQPQHFLVESIELLVYPGDNIGTLKTAFSATNFANDMYAIAKGGSLNYFIGSKTYLEEAPLGRFPPKTKLGVEGAYGIQRKQAAAADAEDQVSIDYACWTGRPYYLDPPTLLVPNQNFSVSLNWPTAVALPSTVDAKVFVVLDGILYRQSQ